MTFDLRMAVFSGGRLTAAQQAQELLSCNDDTAAYGLRLTPQQAQALLDTRSAALQNTGRVELGGTILRRMILRRTTRPPSTSWWTPFTTSKPRRRTGWVTRPCCGT